MNFLQISVTGERNFNYGCEQSKTKKTILSSFSLKLDEKNYEVKYVLGSRTFPDIRTELGISTGNSPIYIFEDDKGKTVVLANKLIRPDNLLGLVLTEWAQFNGDDTFLKK